MKKEQGVFDNSQLIKNKISELITNSRDKIIDISAAEFVDWYIEEIGEGYKKYYKGSWVEARHACWEETCPKSTVS